MEKFIEKSGGHKNCPNGEKEWPGPEVNGIIGSRGGHVRAGQKAQKRKSDQII
jgi:hypothetical protein